MTAGSLSDVSGLIAINSLMAMIGGILTAALAWLIPGDFPVALSERASGVPYAEENDCFDNNNKALLCLS